MYFLQKYHTTRKDDATLVTSIDRDAERVVIDVLQKHAPHAVMSEEFGSIAGETGLTWLIDPIDGTTNFARKNWPFAVSVALSDADKVAAIES